MSHCLTSRCREVYVGLEIKFIIIMGRVLVGVAAVERLKLQ